MLNIKTDIDKFQNLENVSNDAPSLNVQKDVAGAILQEASARVQELLGTHMDELSIEQVVLGLFFTGVRLNDGNGGLCFTPIKMIPEAVCCPSSAKAMPESGRFRGKKVTASLADLSSPNPLKKAIAIATLNALTEICWKKRLLPDYQIQFDADPFDQLNIAEGSFTVVVGALLPYIKHLKKNQLDYAILELDPKTLREEELPHFIPPEKGPEAISKADTLIITGTTLITDTLEDILKHRKPTAETIVVGPTASVLPEPFFNRGVTRLGGISVINAESLLNIISEGGSGYHFYNKFAIKTVISKKQD